MVTTMDMWEIFMNKPSAECVTLFEDEYKISDDLPDLRNHNLVLMDIGEWQRAKDNCRKIIDEDEYTGEDDFVNMGMIEWFLGNITSAIDFWKQSMNTQYADNAGAINGPLILWYACQRLKDEKLRKFSEIKLKRFWKVKDYRIINDWINSIAVAGFLLKEVPVTVFLHEWKSEIDSLEYRRQCRVNFWVGMKCLKDGDKATSAAYFKSAFSGPKIAILEYEYFLAKWEYSQLTGENVWNK